MSNEVAVGQCRAAAARRHEFLVKSPDTTPARSSASFGLLGAVAAALRPRLDRGRALMLLVALEVLVRVAVAAAAVLRSVLVHLLGACTELLRARVAVLAHVLHWMPCQCVNCSTAA